MFGLMAAPPGLLVVHTLWIGLDSIGTDSASLELPSSKNPVLNNFSATSIYLAREE